MAIHIQNIFISAVFKKDCVCRLTTLCNIWLIRNTKESMLWNYKTFHFSPKMRQMRYPDCKTTHNKIATAKSDDSKLLFKLISQQRGKTQDVTDELIVDDKVLGTPQQISEAFSEHFHNLTNPDHSTEFSQSYKDDAVFNRMLIDDICSASEDNIEYITHEEMYGIINSLSNGKAADVHELTAEHLKGCGMGPWLVLVSPCFRKNIVATCKLGLFCVV